jgi:hypothetical protein
VGNREAFVAFELVISGRYGFMQDELYFIAASHHLAFGYVDQPPLAPLLTRIADILGVSPAAIRIAPALADGAMVVLTARQGRALRRGPGRPGSGRARDGMSPRPAGCRPFRQRHAAGSARIRPKTSVP